jgi:hypothetical protein
MVARGAIHNPKIFMEYKNEFENIELNKEKVFENILNFKDEDNIDNIINENFSNEINNNNINNFNNHIVEEENNKENIKEIQLELNENDKNKNKDKENHNNNHIDNHNDSKKEIEKGKNNKKKKEEREKEKKEEDDGENMQCSQNLARVLDIKYNGRNFELWDILKEYTKLVI